MSDSILDKLADKALDQFKAKAPDWFDQALASARRKIDSHAIGPDAQNPLATLARNTGDLALDAIEKKRDVLIPLGYDATLAFLGRVAIGDHTKAASILLAYGGGRGAWGEADRTIAAAGDATEKAKRDHDAALATVKEIGTDVARAALPLLLSVARSAVGLA